MWRDPETPEDAGVSGVVLGIETSCDETAAAVVDEDGVVRSSVVASQADLHARYGGVVPEVASRRHLELVSPGRPRGARRRRRHARRRRARRRHAGARASSARCSSGSRPRRRSPGRAACRWCPVDHLRAHVASLYLAPDPLEPPFTCLLASGGHTMLLSVRDRTGFDVLGSTLDDAAGEAFDKGARLLGLGYPGGAEIDRLARDGDPEAYSFPVARVPGLDFSFSGPQDRAAVRRARPLGRTSSTRAAPTSRPRTSGRSSGRSSVASARRPRRPATARSPSSAASRRTRSCGPRCPTRVSRRSRSAPTTRRWSRPRRGSRRPLSVPRLPCARCVRLGLDAAAPRARRLALVLAVGRRRPARPRRRSAPRAGRGCSAAGRCRSSAAAGSSSSGRRRSPIASAGRGAGRPSCRCARWTAAAAGRAASRDRQALVTRRAGRPRSSRTCACSTASPASVDPTLLPALERDPVVAGVYPVRGGVSGGGAAAPRSTREAFGPASGRRVGIELPGVDGTGIKVALLDTGVDTRHPFLQGRLLPGHRRARRRRRPIRRAEPDRAGAARAARDGARRARRRRAAARRACTASRRGRRSCRSASRAGSPTRTAASPSTGAPTRCSPGSRRPSTRTATATPTTRSGSPSSASSSRSRRSRTARLRVPAVARSRSTRSSSRPPGTTGRRAPATAASPRPAAHPGVLGVAASDSRGRSPTVHVLLRAGLRVLASGETPLGGAVGPTDVVSRAGRRAAAPGGRRGHAGQRARPAVRRGPATAGSPARPCCCRPGRRRPRPCASSRRRARAPCSSTGRSRPARSASTSRSRCRSSGSPRAPPSEVRAALADGVPVELGVGAAAFGDNPDFGAVASFSSTGLALDGSAGAGVAAPGVGLVTSVPGRNEGGSARYGTISGSSAAAAVVAGAAALLAQARPDLDAAGLRGALVASARRGVGGADPGSSTRPPPRPSSSSPTRRTSPFGALIDAAQGTLRARHAAQRLASRPRRASSGPAPPPAGVVGRRGPDRVALQPGRVEGRHG